jgi:hypothetical protein
LCFVQFQILRCLCAYRDEKVVGVFVRFRAPALSGGELIFIMFIDTYAFGSDKVLQKPAPWVKQWRN